jgi:acyl carrier protein
LATEQTYKRLTGLMRKLFREESLVASPELTARGVKGWDSLAHIRFIIEVERAFGIKFATPEISKFKNVGELADMIEKKSS